MKKVAIIIPTYKEVLTNDELYSLKRCRTILKDFPIIFVAPNHLSLDNYVKNEIVIKFDDKYFESIQGYNQFMMSNIFYEQFLGYEFILIYQLDAVVLKNELDFWCEKNYDYIGASWVYEPEPTFLKTLKKEWRIFKFLWKYKGKKVAESGLDMNNFAFKHVGNGGFSLRKTQKMLEITQKYENWISEILKTDIPEDIFWGVLLNLHKKNELKTAPFKDGLGFAFDMRPSICYKITNQKLPFGCHDYIDWEPDFWKNILENVLPLQD